MVSPYTKFPFVSEYPDRMYVQKSPAYPEQAYSQEYISAPQFYPVQDQYETYENSNNSYLGFISRPEDPPPQLSNNPVTANIVLFKELSAYPNYGNPSGNADILYTGTRGTWTFESPAFLFVPGNLRARIVIRAVLDDHFNVPVNQYSARITINGRVVHNGSVPLQHGSPAGGMFTNWRELTFSLPNQRRVNSVTIENTSSTGPSDWLGFDWMELRVVPR